MEGSLPKKKLRFSDNEAESSFLLFEMTEDLLRELQTSGRFEIKGSEEESAVLCTEMASFTIQQAPSTNSMLLMTQNPLKGFDDCTTVLKTLKETYLLNRTTVNMEKLKSLMNAVPISSDELSPSAPAHSANTQLYTYKHLDDIMQCSQHELKVALSVIDAFEFKGHFRIFDVDSEYALARHTLLSMLAEGHSLDSLNIQDVLRASKDGTYEPLLIDQIVSAYLTKLEDSSSLYIFNSRKYSALAADALLRKQPDDVLLSTFKPRWQHQVTDHISVSLEDLEGLAVLEEVGKSDFKLIYLPSRLMSHNPKLRLTDLFRVKPKWTLAQIKPYLQDFLALGATEEKILVEHARSSNGPDGSKLYSTR